MNKLNQLAVIEGYKNAQEMFEDGELIGDCTVPGICQNVNCDFTTHYEPDQDKGWCEVCETNTVVSALVMAGFI